MASILRRQGHSRLCGLTRTPVRPTRSESLSPLQLAEWFSGRSTDKQTRGENNGEWKESGPLSSFSAGFFLPSRVLPSFFPSFISYRGSDPSRLVRHLGGVGRRAGRLPFRSLAPVPESERPRPGGRRAIRAPSWLQCDLGGKGEFVRGLTRQAVPENLSKH